MTKEDIDKEIKLIDEATSITWDIKLLFDKLYDKIDRIVDLRTRDWYTRAVLSDIEGSTDADYLHDTLGTLKGILEDVLDNWSDSDYDRDNS